MTQPAQTTSSDGPVTERVTDEQLVIILHRVSDASAKTPLVMMARECQFHRANANAGKREAYDDVLNHLRDVQRTCLQNESEASHDNLNDLANRFHIRGDFLYSIIASIEQRRDASGGRGT